MTSETLIVYISYLLLILYSSYTTVTAEDEKLLNNNDANDVTISEQYDPRYLMHRYQNPFYPSNSNVYSAQSNGIAPPHYQPKAYDTMSQNVNFDFRCHCNAKVNRETTAQPPELPIADATPELQEQIKLLQEQIKKQAAQLRRQQQIASQGSGLEQFASLLTMSDGLDCSCSGSIPNFGSTQQQQPMLQQQGIGSQPSMHQNMAGIQLTPPFNTPLMPLQPFPLFP